MSTVIEGCVYDFLQSCQMVNSELTGRIDSLISSQLAVSVLMADEALTWVKRCSSLNSVELCSFFHSTSELLLSLGSPPCPRESMS